MLPIMLIHILLASCTTQAPIINGTAYNLSSYQQLYTYVNGACGGLVGWAVAAMFFIVLLLLSISYSDLGVGVMVAGGVMTILTVIAQQIGIVGSNMPLLFGGVAILGLIISVLQGVLDPFR